MSSLDFANAVDHRRLPRAGAVDPPHRDGSRAARRTDVRHRRPDEQHADEARCRRFPASATFRSSACCSEQGAPEEPDRARRHDHAGHHQARPDGRVGRPAGAHRAVSRRPRQDLPNPDPYIGSPRFPADQPTPRTEAPLLRRSLPPSRRVPRASRRRPGPIVNQVAAPVTRRSRVVESRPISRRLPSGSGAHAADEAGAESDRAGPRRRAQGRDRCREGTRRAGGARRRAEEGGGESRSRSAASRQARLDAEQAKLNAEQAKRDEANRLQADKVARERERREADAARKKAEEDQKRDKALTDAASRLKQAQAAVSG